MRNAQIESIKHTPQKRFARTGPHFKFLRSSNSKSPLSNVTNAILYVKETNKSPKKQESNLMSPRESYQINRCRSQELIKPFQSFSESRKTLQMNGIEYNYIISSETKFLRLITKLEMQVQELKETVKALQLEKESHRRVCQVSKMTKKDSIHAVAVEIQNKKLLKQIQELKIENNELLSAFNKKTKQQNKKTVSKQDESSAYFSEYLKGTQNKLIDLRDQNKKLRLQIDFLHRKLHNNMEQLKKSNNNDMALLKEKYVKLLNEYKTLSKSHCDLTLKMKKLQMGIQSKQQKSLVSLEHSLSYSSVSSSQNR